MCGRFSNVLSPEDLHAYFGLAEEPESLASRYNISPPQDVAVIRQQGDERALSFLRWGLMPHWAKDVKIGYGMINVRTETLASKPSLRAAFRARRFIVPASGFYEWRKGTIQFPLACPPRVNLGLSFSYLPGRMHCWA